MNNSYNCYICDKVFLSVVPITKKRSISCLCENCFFKKDHIYYCQSCKQLSKESAEVLINKNYCLKCYSDFLKNNL